MLRLTPGMFLLGWGPQGWSVVVHASRLALVDSITLQDLSEGTPPVELLATRELRHTGIHMIISAQVNMSFVGLY